MGEILCLNTVPKKGKNPVGERKLLFHCPCDTDISTICHFIMLGFVCKTEQDRKGSNIIAPSDTGVSIFCYYAWFCMSLLTLEHSLLNVLTGSRLKDGYICLKISVNFDAYIFCHVFFQMNLKVILLFSCEAQNKGRRNRALCQAGN